MTDDALANVTLPWTMEQLYALIMYDLEQDLLLENIPMLEEKYADETPQERVARFERYAQAIEAFIERFKALMAQWSTEIQQLYQRQLSGLQEFTSGADSGRLQELSDLINPDEV